MLREINQNVIENTKLKVIKIKKQQQNLIMFSQIVHSQLFNLLFKWFHKLK